ncbi:MAG: cytidine deaminase [Candidatus Cryptobacteroides sp.]
MTKKELTISYIEYNSVAELDAEDRILVGKAIEAMDGSYAPYSNFNVGAAVRLESGTIVTGANQENAAYPSGLCAERSAMFSAGSQHKGDAIRSIAVVGGPQGCISDTPASPCGACRQVMAQYQRIAGKDMSVILVGAKVIYKFARVDDILPLIFDNL